jgi:hypothetical protein
MTKKRRSQDNMGYILCVGILGFAKISDLSGALQLLANATTYQAWLTAAEKLDELEGVGEWKKDPTSPYYDSRLIQERLVEMKRVGSRLPI